MTTNLHITNATHSQRCPVTCTELGCTQESNGIEPFDKCPKHFAAYQARLARHDLISDLVHHAVGIDEVARELLSAFSRGPVEWHPATVRMARDGEPDRDELAGVVMDLICAGSNHGGDSPVVPPAAIEAFRNFSRRGGPLDGAPAERTR